MFSDIFQLIKNRVPEISYIGIWDRDGLEVERILYGRQQLNTELLGAECADMVSRLAGLSEGRVPGVIEARWQDNTISALPLNQSFFLLVLTGAPALPGKTRFYMQINAPRLAAMLGG